MSTNNIPSPLLHENVWRDAHLYIEAENQFQEFCASKKTGSQSTKVMKSPFSLVDEIALARQRIQNTLKDMDVKQYDPSPWIKRITDLEIENRTVTQKLDVLTSRVAEFSDRLCKMEKTLQNCHNCSSKIASLDTAAVVSNGPGKSAAVDDDNDDIDLFGSDEETEDDKRVKEERVKAYEDKKSKKKQIVAKSSIVLDIKPWDDETDMVEMEKEVRKISTEGLKWGAGKLVPLAYGIRKLQIVCIVEDELVSVDWLQETIQEGIESMVQSVDIAAFNKL